MNKEDRFEIEVCMLVIVIQIEIALLLTVILSQL